jgi:hypothetical protein
MTLTYRTEVLTAREATITKADMSALTSNWEDGGALATGNSDMARLHGAGNWADSHGIHEGYKAGALDAAGQTIKGAKQRRNAMRAARKDFRKDPYAAVESVKFKVPKLTTLMIEGIEIISEGITTSVNDMVTEVVIQFQAQDVKQMSSIHESSELSFAPEDLPSDIYAELRGQAEAETETLRKGVIKDMKGQSRALRKELREGRRARRKIRGSDDLPPYSVEENYGHGPYGMGNPSVGTYEPD